MLKILGVLVASGIIAEWIVYSACKKIFTTRKAAVLYRTATAAGYLSIAGLILTASLSAQYRSLAVQWIFALFMLLVFPKIILSIFLLLSALWQSIKSRLFPLIRNLFIPHRFSFLYRCGYSLRICIGYIRRAIFWKVQIYSTPQKYTHRRSSKKF